MKSLLIFLLCFFATIAFAKNIRMVQVDKTFMGDLTDADAEKAFEDPRIEEKHKVTSIQAKKGDTIEFINRDEVSHNVSGVMKEKVVFDVKLQGPGKVNDRKIEFKEPGEYTVQCAIHPKMKIKVTVD